MWINIISVDLNQEYLIFIKNIHMDDLNMIKMYIGQKRRFSSAKFYRSTDHT